MARNRRAERHEFTPTYEDMQKAAENRSAFDPMLKDVSLFKPRQGSNLIRIMPPTWENARHYGLRLKVHRNIGPHDRQYLCLKENPTSPHKRCPICEELFELGPRASTEEKSSLRAGDSVIYYILDRDAEKEGLQVWQTSAKNDSEIAAQAINPRSKAVINISHPDDGYDVEFTRTGTTRNNTRYRGFKIMRDPSPLSDNGKRYDALLDEIYDNPLPNILQFYSPEHIEEVFYGRAKDDDSPRKRIRDRDEDEDDDRPARRRSSRDEEDEPEEEIRPARRRATRDEDEDEPEERPRRSRSRDEDEEETPSTRRKSREVEPEEDDERPARRRSSRDEPEEDERPARRGRTQTEEDLDDEIPSEGGRRAKPNGRDEEEEKPTRRARLEPEEEETRPARRSRAAEPEEAEERPTRRRAREAEPEEEEEEEKPRRGRAAREEPEEDENAGRRSRMRSRLDRSAD